MAFFKKLDVLILIWGFAGILLFSCSSEVNRETERKVYIEKSSNGYRLVRNQKPFFIKGASGNGYFQELREAGANTVRLYDTLDLRSTLDSAQKYGLAAVIDLPLPRYQGSADTIYNDSLLSERLIKSTLELVKKHQNHPAVLYWILGNEVYVPKLFSNDFVACFNKLIQKINYQDPDHPISTTVSSAGLNKVFSILLKSPDLDFISVNNFGALHDFKLDRNILFFWTKPYVLSEWGNNGPWESNKTLWAAPIEVSSTTRAERYKTQYLQYINSIDDGRCMGSLAFYWGYKQERTHTWFSLFSEDGKQSQTTFELENLWKGTNKEFTGPKLDQVLVNGQTGRDNILLRSGEKVRAEISLSTNNQHLTYTTEWEVQPENWYYRAHAVEERPEMVSGSVIKAGNTDLIFKAPDQEGPYRLFVKVIGKNGYIATANTPFYVLNSVDVP